MMKPCLFAVVAGLMLVSASPPGGAEDAASASASAAYPPCSRTVKDRCIQLYERGVGSPENLAANAGSGKAAPAAATGGPYEPAPAASAYPPCTAKLQDRCNQLVRRHVRHARHVRRAGERG
jgi:hypothetical protein